MSEEPTSVQIRLFHFKVLVLECAGLSYFTNYKIILLILLLDVLIRPVYHFHLFFQ